MNKPEAIETLKEMAPKGTKLYTVLEHVSASRSTRYFKVLLVADGDIVDVSWLVRLILDIKLHNTYSGVKISGGGMDMAFALVYELSSALYNDGYAFKKESL